MLAESLYSKPIICQSCESAEELDIEKQNLLLDIMDIIYVRIFVLGHNLFLEGNIFLELRSGKTVHFSKQMSAGKYPCIFSGRMEAIVVYIS